MKKIEIKFTVVLNVDDLAQIEPSHDGDMLRVNDKLIMPEMVYYQTDAREPKNFVQIHDADDSEADYIYGSIIEAEHSIVRK